MAPRRVIAIVALVVCATGTQVSQAANQFFMPGDAFFHTLLTQKSLNRIAKSPQPVFTYHRPSHLPSMFCGYAGFATMQYKDMPASLRRNLQSVYRTVRKQTPLRVEITDEMKIKKTPEGDVEVPTGRKLQREINGLSVFFYNSSFDFTKRRLALKYNEKWADEFAAFGHRRDDAMLEAFAPLPKAIAEDWRDAKTVPALQAVVPAMTAKNIGKPVQVQGKLMAIVVSNPDYGQLFEARSGVLSIKAPMRVFSSDRRICR